MAILQQSFPETPAAYKFFPELSELIYPVRILPIPDSELAIVLDNTSTDVILIDHNGTELSRAGGSGRGPGEFEALGLVHRDLMGNIYVMDLMLRRFQVFGVDLDQKELTYKGTINMKPIDSGSLLSVREIFMTEHGNFGVFNQNTDYRTGENKYYLYTVDDEFWPLEQLLELPGDERVQIDELAFIRNLVGESVFWDVDGEWFYHLTSHSPVIYKYHLPTGIRDTVNLPDITHRENTPFNIEYLKDLYKSLVEWNPAVKEEFEKKEVLPVFQDISVQNNMIALNTFHAGGEYGIILLMNQETDEINYLKTPQLFERISLHDTNIYGIDFTNVNIEGQTVMYVEMDKSSK